MSNLIGTNANQVPTCGMLGTLAFMDAANVTSVTTATGMTTLTSTATLLQITPASYGVAVTLPDATTCTVGVPLHIIDNKGAYPVRVLNSAGTLLGFIFAGVVSHVSLADKSTAAGVWMIENSELVGASAQLLTTSLAVITSCIALDSDRELILGAGANPYYGYAVVYNKTTNAFGTPTLIRSVSFNANGYQIQGVLSAADQVLVVSCNNGPLFEAVTLSISGTTITVNAAATATLSANISAFADGCGLIAVGSSFVCSYTVATPAAQIRALSISGTTVTIGSATVLDGTAGGLIAVGDSTHVIAASTATTHLYTKPYLVSGSTLTAGTGTDTNSGTMVLQKFAALGSRWFVAYANGAANDAAVVSLNATGNGTTTVSAATGVTTQNGTTGVDAIVISSTKVLLVSNASSSNANILTDTAGTASAGTAITLSSNTTRACLYASGTDVFVQDGSTSPGYVIKVDCSGASPVKTATLGGNGFTFSSPAPSNAVLSRSPFGLYGTAFYQAAGYGTNASLYPQLQVRSGTLDFINRVTYSGYKGTSFFRGASESSAWQTDAATVITKLECVA